MKRQEKRLEMKKNLEMLRKVTTLTTKYKN